MKKSLFLQCALTALLSLSFSSCSEDEPNSVKPDPIPGTVETAGVYILNQGQFYQNIEGSLNYFSYETKSVSTDLFQKANKKSLGNTPQCGVKYGSKIYIGVYGSNTVWVLDAKTFTTLNQISLTPEKTGTQPRGMVTKNGKVYITMYDGYVARLDTTTMDIDARVKVGPNPEKPAIVGNRLYVPNSDGMNWEVGYGTTASIIDLDSFSVTDTVEVPLNPETFLSIDNKLYLLAKGNYGDVASAIYEVDPEIATIQKADAKEPGYKFMVFATLVAAGKADIYYIDAPFDKPEIKYGKFDSKTGEKSEWKAEEVAYPNAIAVDPYNGNIFITSYVMDGPYPSYIAPGYIVRYNTAFKFIDKAEVGAGPACMFFN